MSIKLDKILTMSAKDYCEMQGKKLCEYEAKGIHYESFKSSEIITSEIIIKFSKIVPSETEVIVDYRFFIGGAETEGNEKSERYVKRYASGTALIPKNIQKDKN